MSKKRNYFKEMSTGLYRVNINHMALYDVSAANDYVKPSVINNLGEIVTVENNYIDTAITIVTMVEVHSKGYPFILKNMDNIPEILDIVYGHITACIEHPDNVMLGKLPVPEEDLIKMEDFMVAVMKMNPNTVLEKYYNIVEKKRNVIGMGSRFDDAPTMESTGKDVNSFRRIKNTKNLDDLTFEELLNTF